MEEPQVISARRRRAHDIRTEVADLQRSLPPGAAAQADLAIAHAALGRAGTLIGAEGR